MNAELKLLLSSDPILNRSIGEETRIMDSTERLQKIREIIDKENIKLQYTQTKTLLGTDPIIYRNPNEEIQTMTDDERMELIYEHISIFGFVL